MASDRITKICVRGMRTLLDIRLDLHGLRVLIGENGSGKSTLVEACELLHKAARPGLFIPDSLDNFHGGIDSLLRQGERELTLAARIEGGDGPPIDYSFCIGLVGLSPRVLRESAEVLIDGEPRKVLDRSTDEASVYTNPRSLAGMLAEAFVSHRAEPGSAQPADEWVRANVDSRSLALHSFGVIYQPALPRILTALAGISVHVPFSTHPIWLQAELQQRSGMRWPQIVEPTQTLARMGSNLANCFQALRNGSAETWSEVLQTARLGLGDDLRDISVSSPARGNIELAVHFGSLLQPVPATLLSEGQLVFLGFVALSALQKAHSLIVFDEPELHLHPGLLVRVVWLLEQIGRDCPVLVATHSDRLLDALSDPASSAVLCELDQHRATRLHFPDQEALSNWLKDYRGLGQLRAEGYEPHVFVNDEGER